MQASILHIAITINQSVLEFLVCIEKIASSDCSILLIGGTGVDKEIKITLRI